MTDKASNIKTGRRIARNRYDNWNGYKGTRKVVEFGGDEQAARSWMDGSDDEREANRAKPLDPTPTVEPKMSFAPAKSGLAAKLNASRPAVSAPHIVVEALAGSGKTFTQVVGVAWAFGEKVWPEVQRTIAERINEKAGCRKVDPDTFRITPSPEQQKVWDAFAQSRGQVRTVTYCAFNKSIVTEFGHEWGWLVKLLSDECGITLQFATINSLGNTTLRQTYGWLNITDAHSENLLAKELGYNDPREAKQKFAVIMQAVPALVDLCKLTLAGWTEQGGFSADNVDDDCLDSLCSFYDVETNGSRASIFQYVRKVLALSVDPSETRECDFNDQNWLPVIHGLSVAKADFLLIDESQDLSRVKQEFGRMIGRRICAVGDIHQAIYGFAGADTNSIPRLKEMLGVQTSLRLTETRRCGKAIVKEAQRYVKNFSAHESNPEGDVQTLSFMQFPERAKDGDMVLCRTNAPLVQHALRFLKNGRKVSVRGRDFGKSLVNFVKRLNAKDIPHLITKVGAWVAVETEKEAKKKNPSEARLIALQDREACIYAFSQSCETVDAIIQKMWQIFSGKECPRCRKGYGENVESCYDCKCPTIMPKGVIFSSVHRAKGLEASRVFILLPKDAPMPHPLAKSQWQKEQELNLAYIAVTRSINELVYVKGD